MKIGLTGGIGSGKSFVAEQFVALGVQVIDADQIARDLVQRNSPMLALIADHFGQGILTETGDLDRKALRSRIFNSEEDRRWVESVMHPRVREEIVAAMSGASGPYSLLMSPLMFETGQDRMVDSVIVVDIPRELQLQRAAARDAVDAPAIEKIIDAQLDRAERLARADYIIDNSGPRDATCDQVRSIHQRILGLCSADET